MHNHHSFTARLFAVYVLILNAVFAPTAMATATACESPLKPVYQFQKSLQKKMGLDGTETIPAKSQNCNVKQSVKGRASFYGKNDGFAGKPTASGTLFNPQALTAAHRTLPFGTRVKLTNLKNGKTVIVTINDRGPFIKGRELDVSYKAAQNLSFVQDGTAKLKIDICSPRNKI